MATSKEAIRREWAYCAQSFPYFFQHYWKVIVPQRGLINVDVRKPQLEAAELFQNNRRVCVLKARQIGWSTLITAYLVWLGFFHEHKAIAVLSRREDPEAKLIISNAKLGYDNLPIWMRRRGPTIINDHQTKIVFSNGSTIESDASKDNPVRGRTLDCLVLDEFGKFPNPEQAWGSALPATEYGQLFVVGNANYFGSRWHQLYSDAKNKLNDFIARFYPWNIDGMRHRTPEWLANETSSMTPAERSAEYPENDEECWIAAGTPVFDVDVIKNFPVLDGVHGLYDGENYREDPEGWACLWERPQKNKKYVIGVDVARGLHHGDYSAAVVLDHFGQHVFSIHCHMKPVAFAFACNIIGRWYNNALLGVESNNVGAAVLDTLVEDLYYPNLYQRMMPNEVTQRMTVQYGWHTSDQTKPLAISHLNDALIHRKMTTSDPKLIAELVAFRYLGDGKTGGSPHDDMVMAAAIAYQMLRQVYVPMALPEGPVNTLAPSKFAEFDGTFHGLARLGDDLPKDEGELVVMNRDAGMAGMRGGWW